MGGVEKIDQQMAAFREALEYCKLEDLRCMGPTFTWITTIRCCLDTPVANEGWQELFPNYAVKAQNGPPSDNCSLILVAKKGRTSYKKKKIARFESTWLRHPKF